jgi:bifunctional non-homologous end joining protein LigD
MLPHMRDRPLTLIRQPAGIGGRRFVHLHYEQPLPSFVHTVDIHSDKAGRAEQYLLCNNVATLLWLAHVGSLEFHIWHSRARQGADAKGASTDYAGSARAVEQSVLNRPDYIVCDIDPYIYSGDEPAGAAPQFNRLAWERCLQVALALKAALDSMQIHSIVKTSGATGLHILIPVLRTITFEAARALSQTLGQHLLQMHPRLVTLDQRIAGRTGKVFFDYGMNARVKTLVAPYSARGIAGAPVSMPITWAELPDVTPLDYTLQNVADLLEQRGDLWRDIDSGKQDIEALLEA